MKAVTRWGVAGLFCTFGAAGVATVSGLRLNLTPSIPLGLYVDAAGAPVVGDYVVACPPDTPVFEMAKQRGYIGAGFCRGNLSPLLKKLAAAEGDQVEVSSLGISVNGQRINGSVPLESDLGGRAMPTFRIYNSRLSASELALVGDGDGVGISFDTRYVGLFDRAQILGKIRPLLTW